ELRRLLGRHEAAPGGRRVVEAVAEPVFLPDHQRTPATRQARAYATSTPMFCSVYWPPVRTRRLCAMNMIAARRPAVVFFITRPILNTDSTHVKHRTPMARK